MLVSHCDAPGREDVREGEVLIRPKLWRNLQEVRRQPGSRKPHQSNESLGYIAIIIIIITNLMVSNIVDNYQRYTIRNEKAALQKPID